MNRARQDAITTEIMEIVGGAEAMRSGDAEDSEPVVWEPSRRGDPASAFRPSRLTCPIVSYVEQHHDRHRTHPQVRPHRRHRRPGDRRRVPARGACPRSTARSSSTIVVDDVSIDVIAEVAQQIGDNRVRAIAMKPTDGLTRGAHGAQPRPRHPGAGRRRHARPRVQRHRRAARRRERRRRHLLGHPPSGPGCSPTSRPRR